MLEKKFMALNDERRVSQNVADVNKRVIQDAINLYYQKVLISGDIGFFLRFGLFLT